MTVLPLAGVRVLDLTWAWAGPYCSLQLAHLGAEVIRIESQRRPDMNRRVPPYADGIPGLNRGGSFNQWNQGKRSVTIDISREEGAAIVREMARLSDVVVENFAAGVLDRHALGYLHLREFNPQLIMVSLSGYGATGPLSRAVAYGVPLVMISGLASLSGYPGGPPCEVGISYGDPNAGLHAAVAVLAALWYREETGEGQYIDLAQWESLIAVLPEGVMSYVMTGTQPPRMGNRDPLIAPHGYFPTAGEDCWIGIAIEDDHEWRSFCDLMGVPALAEDPRFATARQRKQNEDELESTISSWTKQYDAWALTVQLQEKGIPAFPVQSMHDLVEDEHLNTRGFFVRLPHPEVGRRTHAGIPWHLSPHPLNVQRPAPLLGQDNEYVIKEMLGKSDTEYQQLIEANILF